jgi:hypothetical protein
MKDSDSRSHSIHFCFDICLYQWMEKPFSLGPTHRSNMLNWLLLWLGDAASSGDGRRVSRSMYPLRSTYLMM